MARRGYYDARVREETIEGTFDGPRLLVHDGAETRWAVTPARASAELEARTRLAAHPLAAAPVRREGDVLVFPRLGPLADPEDALDAVVVGAPAAIEVRVTVRELFHAFGGPVDAVRGLGRAGVARSAVDRVLSQSIAVQTPRGTDLGGLMPSAVRSSTQGATAISVRYGRVEGWPVLDLASLALRGGLDGAGAHAAMGGGQDAFDLALTHQALRELASVRDEARRAPLRDLVRATVERFVAAIPPSKPRRIFAFEPRRERRMRLFSRFFDGIQYDDEGLFSATPEALALRLVDGLEGVVVDATAGIGSIAIALARTPGVTRVIAIDRDPQRLRMAAHNASVYGVADRIDFREADAIEVVPTLRFDAIVIDPPWGGRDYDRGRVTLADLPMPIAPLLASDRVVIKLPRSFDASTLPPGFEIEPMIDDRGVLKMLVARRGLRSAPR
jgi:trimethylguanosine synthase